MLQSQLLSGHAVNKPISHFLGESLLIVFSIMLALGANEWRTHANDARNLKRAVTDLSAEISENLTLLDGLPEYHRMIGRGLRQSAEGLRESNADHSKTPVELVMELDGLRAVLLGYTGHLQSVSWQTAKDRNIVAQLEYETAKALSATYDEQLVSINSMMRKIGDEFSNIKMYESQNQEAVLTALSATFFEFAAREETLIFLLEKNLTILNEKYPKAVRTDKQDEI
jgi:hypothetical protein